MNTHKQVSSMTNAVIAGIVIFGSCEWAAAHGDRNILIGRSGSGQLKAVFAEPDEAYLLPPVNGLLHGWSNNLPAFNNLEIAEPENDFYPLEPGAAVWLDVVLMDPALRMIDAGFEILDQPGETTFLGGDAFHTHVTWHINSDDPAFDAGRWLWSARFIVRDAGSTNYSTSATVEARFTNVGCEPGDLNADGTINQFDIQGFVDALGGAGAPGTLCAADANQDGSVNQFDIQAFVDLLSH